MKKYAADEVVTVLVLGPFTTVPVGQTASYPFHFVEGAITLGWAEIVETEMPDGPPVVATTTKP